MDIQVMPALMPRSYEDLERGVRVFSQVPYVQIDSMDGQFVPTKSWPYVGEHSKSEILNTTLPYVDNIFFEVHLMVQEPEEIGTAFIYAGAKRIVAHIESFAEPHRLERARACFACWRAFGAEVGLSVLLDTPLSVIAPLIASGDVDAIQVMSIAQIGVQGSAFDVRAYDRIRELRMQYPALPIAVDGGIKQEHVKNLIDAGATRLCVGSALIHAHDAMRAYREFVMCTHQ